MLKDARVPSRHTHLPLGVFGAIRLVGIFGNADPTCDKLQGLRIEAESKFDLNKGNAANGVRKTLPC